MSGTILRNLPGLLATVIPIAGITITGCSKVETGNPTHVFRTYQENGITILENSGIPKYPGELFTYQEVARLIEDEAIPESLLIQPTTIRLDEHGMIYAEDNAWGGIRRLLVYHPNGEFSHQIGRSGEGPGEYISPQIVSLENDEAIIFDFNLRRASWFHSDGRFIRSISIQTAMREPLSKIDITPEGGLILFGQVMDDWDDEEFRYLAYRVTVLSADGDTLGIISTPKTIMMRMVTVGGRPSSAPSYYSGWAWADYSPTLGIMVTTGLSPTIMLVKASCIRLSASLGSVFSSSRDSGVNTSVQAC